MNVLKACRPLLLASAGAAHCAPGPAQPQPQLATGQQRRLRSHRQATQPSAARRASPPWVPHRRVRTARRHFSNSIRVGTLRRVEMLRWPLSACGEEGPSSRQRHCRRSQSQTYRSGEPPRGSQSDSPWFPTNRLPSATRPRGFGLASCRSARESQQSRIDPRASNVLRISFSLSAGAPKNDLCQLLVNFAMPRNCFFALTISPNVVSATPPEEAPTAIGQFPLEVATLHGVKCTPICVLTAGSRPPHGGLTHRS